MSATALTTATSNNANTFSASAHLQQGDQIQVDAFPYVDVLSYSVNSSPSGGQYGLTQNPEGSTTDIIFVPYNVSSYTLTISLTANSSYTIFVSKLSAVKTPIQNFNVSAGQSQLVVKTTVSASSPTTPPSPWDPLFGFTGFKVGGVTITFANFVEALAATSAFFIGLGLYFKSKISYLGGILLVFVLIIEVGFLPLIAFGVFYLVGFAVVNLVWKIKHRYSRGGPAV
jgi:hypothetical protein